MPVLLRALIALALLAPLALHAQDFHGQVTHVSDGDTLWVRPAGGGRPRQVRLLDLDAPEACQSHGPEAGQALRGRVLHQPVHVRAAGFDDFGRQLARVEHRGEDVGAWMVRQGHAWSMRFKGRAGPYAQLEASARKEGRGLWSQDAPLEPRSFRRRFGRCR